MAAGAGEVDEGLGHEGGAHAVFLGDGADHVFEEDVAVGGDEGGGVGPVHLVLAVGVFVVVLVRLPPQGVHGVGDLGDDVVAAHEGELVVAGLGLAVGGVGDGGAVGLDEEELGLDAGPHLEGAGGGDDAAEDVAGGLVDELAGHPGVGGHPADFGLPGELDEAGRVGDGEDVGVGGGHVEPGGETGEPGAVFGHAVDGGGGDEFCAQDAEEVGVGDEEVADAAFLGDLAELHGGVLRRRVLFAPGPSSPGERGVGWWGWGAACPLTPALLRWVGLGGCWWSWGAVCPLTPGPLPQGEGAWGWVGGRPAPSPRPSPSGRGGVGLGWGAVCALAPALLRWVGLGGCWWGWGTAIYSPGGRIVAGDPGGAGQGDAGHGGGFDGEGDEVFGFEVVDVAFAAGAGDGLGFEGEDGEVVGEAAAAKDGV